MKKQIIVLLFIVTLILFNALVFAADITKNSTIKLNNSEISKNVLDGNEKTYITIPKNGTIEIETSQSISGLYIVYELRSVAGLIYIDGTEIKIGENGFLHEYIPLDGDENTLSIEYEDSVKIADIYVLSTGELPDFVEVWQEPCEVSDLLLFSTHSDDEQLFFLGLMPTYVSRGAFVQVVYFTNHNDNPSRLHEQLHGLYAVGIRNYPVMGLIPDAYSTNLKDAIANMNKAQITEDDAVLFQVQMIRRFKPKVVVGHDESGEYGHGQHILNTYLLKKAITLASDSTYDVETINKYGTWDIKKLYLHLYKENPITMNYDIPLDYFNGKTAYEVSKIGYSKHLSQQWTWFTKWINGENNSFKKATDIKTYSPLNYGLYYTTVGEDINKDDMFENVEYYKDEFLRKEREEEDRKNAEALEAHNKMIEAQRLRQEELKNEKSKVIWTTIIICAICAFFLIVMLCRKKK